MRNLALPLVPLLLLSCGREPAAPIESLASASFRVENGIDICHSTEGSNGFMLIFVAAAAVDAHLNHGDGRIGASVPNQTGMHFSAACEPTPSRRVITVTGFWDGASYWFAGLFTVASTGPVDATATVSGFTDPMRLALLGLSPQGGSCGTQWLATDLPPGPTMDPPTITAHWDVVPPGTYCLNVVSVAGMPPYPPAYSWTATITYP